MADVLGGAFLYYLKLKDLFFKDTFLPIIFVILEYLSQHIQRFPVESENCIKPSWELDTKEIRKSKVYNGQNGIQKL